MGTKNKKQNELKREILGRLKKPQKSYSKNELVKELQDMFFNEKYIYMKWVIYRLIKETAVDVETNYLLSHIIASTKKWRIRVLNTKMSKKERSEILWHIFRSVPKKEPLRRKILEDISRFETTQVGLLHLVFWFDKFSESKSNLFFEKARQGMEAGDLLVTIVWLQTFKLYGFADELMKSLMNTSGIDYSLPELQSYCTVFNGFSLKEIHNFPYLIN